MASTEAPIGASVIDYIHRNNNNTNNVTDNNKRQASPQANSSSVCDADIPPSLIPCNENTNILLQGPRQSGRSSITMNMAHSIACRVERTSCPTCGANISTACSCVAVSILTPLQQNNNTTNQQEESFPMSCEFVKEHKSLDFAHQLRALQQDKNESPQTTWNKNALRRIQICRMANIRDVMNYLLSVKENSTTCPVGGVILQDFDVLVRAGNSSSGDLSTEQLMTMTQILALLADTVNILRNSLPPTSTFSVLVVLTEGIVPWNVYRLWSTWFSTLLKIRSTKNTNYNWRDCLRQRQDKDEESVESTFVLNRVQQQQQNGKGEQKVEEVAHYAIVRQLNTGSHRIVWKREGE